MTKRKTKKEKNRLFLINMTMILLLAFLVVTVSSDWKQILNNRKQEKELNIKYQELKNNEEKLNSEIIKLKDDEYLARYAKEKFMLSSDGDIIIKLD